MLDAQQRPRKVRSVGQSETFIMYKINDLNVLSDYEKSRSRYGHVHSSKTKELL